MKHSVILANYNGLPHLPEAIESVLSQTDRDFELIIVDDCSTDESLEAIQTFASQHDDLIRVIRHSINSGQAAGMNSGFSASSGEIISFIDSDDYWFDNKLTRVRERLDASPDAALYEHNLSVVRGGITTDELAIEGMTVGNLVTHWQKTDAFPMFTPTSGLSFRRTTLQQVLPMPEDIRISSDGYLTRTSICCGPVIGDMECLGVYRIHDHNNVAENPDYNGWEQFLARTRPHLRAFYQQRSIDLPLHLRHSPQQTGDSTHSQPDQDSESHKPRKSAASRILDISPRKILRRCGILQ